MSEAEVIAPQKIWRVRLFAQELIDCGFFPEMIDPWNKVFKPLLKAKGLPDAYLEDRTPCGMSATDDCITLEFDG